MQFCDFPSAWNGGMPDRYHSFSGWRNQVPTALTTSSSDSNFLPQTVNRWKSEDAKSGLWGGCGNVVHRIVWRLPESWRWCEALTNRAEATFRAGSRQAERTGNTSPFFFQCADIIVWVNCRSSLHHNKQNHSFTVPEHCSHHLTGYWRTSKSCAFPTCTFLTLTSLVV